MNPRTSNSTNRTRKAVPRVRQQRAGACRPCDDTCNRPTPSQAHCAAPGCHRTFGGVGGFDKHRKDGACLDPATLGMTDVSGVWRTPMTDEARARFEAMR